MTSPAVHEDDTQSLRLAGLKVRRHFGEVIAEYGILLRQHEAFFLLEDERQRFEAWGRNFGLFKGGHASLDYRFRDAPHTFRFVHLLMSDLRETLSIVKDIFSDSHGSRQPGSSQRWRYDQPTQLTTPTNATSADTEDFIHDDSSDDEFSKSIPNTSPIETTLQTITTTVDRLYRLSYQIRKPGSLTSTSAVAKYQEFRDEGGILIDLMDCFRNFDREHVYELVKFLRNGVPPISPSGATVVVEEPSLIENEFLLERLIRANTLRRKQFKVWQRRQLKLDSVGDELLPEKAGEAHEMTATRGGDGNEASRSESRPVEPSVVASVTRFDEGGFRPQDNRSEYSSYSYALFANEEDDEKVDIERLPQKVREKREFQCPFCFVLCHQNLSSGTNWETHVFRDLRPYVCTYKDCRDEDQLFDTFRAWTIHELTNHSDPKTDGMSNPMATDRSIDPNEPDRQCPICLAADSKRLHIASHLRRIAYFALPKMTGPLVEEDDANQKSDQADAKTDDGQSTIPLPQEDLIACHLCGTERAIAELSHCRLCQINGLYFFYCDNYCAEEECGHRRDCTISGHYSCSLTHNRKIKHLPPPAPNARVDNSNADSFHTLLTQFNELQQQTMTEDLDMQKAQAFWNPLEAMSKKDATS